MIALPLLEFALVLVRFDHVASVIVNANHSMMGTAALEAAGILFSFEIGGVNRDFVIGIAVMNPYVAAVA